MKRKGSRTLATLLAVASICPLAAMAQNACTAEQSREALASEVLTPFWKTTRMEGETILFQTGPGSSRVTGRLLFPATRILRVTSANGKITYQAGRDYRLHQGAIELTLNTRIPSRTWEQLHPPLTAETSLGEAVDGKTSLLFDRPGNVFQSLQVAVTYEHKQAWAGYVSSPAASLQRTRALLHSKQPIKLVVLGDSISMGSGSSSDYHEPPCQPPYATLVADGLEQRYSMHVALTNLSVGGKTASWGAEMASKAAEEKPDLVILAFGMNDASGHRTAEAYAADIRKMIATVRASSPNADFILVATMSGNPEWSHSSPELYTAYREALLPLAGPGIAIADMTSLSREILKRKTFDDTTANGVNHPNDFGHRIYAQLILELLH